MIKTSINCELLDKSKEDIVDEATKTGGMLGKGIGAILNAAAAGAESFEKNSIAIKYDE